MDSPYDQAVPDEAVASLLQGIDFPIAKTDLADALAQNGAPGHFVDQLMAAPVETFDSLDDVLSHLQDIEDGNTDTPDA